MKKIFLSVCLLISLNAQSLELAKIRTDLYSKNGVNVLKKIELSLEFDGVNLKENENKLIDAVNTVISGFFYEDIFTEMGKNSFKKTLEKFLAKKYKIKIDDIYILSLSGIEKFDLEEFKRFLQSIETKEQSIEIKEQDVDNEVKKALEKSEETPNLKLPLIPRVMDIKTKTMEQFFKDLNEESKNEELNEDYLNVFKNMFDAKKIIQ